MSCSRENAKHAIRKALLESTQTSLAPIVTKELMLKTHSKNIFSQKQFLTSLCEVSIVQMVQQHCAIIHIHVLLKYIANI